MPEDYELPMEEAIERFRRAGNDMPEWSEPSEDAWHRIATELNLTTATSPPPASARRGAVQPEPTEGGLSRRQLITGIGGLIVGAAIGAGVMKLAQDSSGPAPAVKSAVLTPVDRADEKLGIAELRPLDVGYSLAVDVPDGADHPSGYVEVWLINTDLSNIRMVSVGVFAAGTSAQFYVPDDLVDNGYLIVDLSNEEFDSESRHSGDTIMRGELRA